jgi:hypothetical protein
MTFALIFDVFMLAQMYCFHFDRVFAIHDQLIPEHLTNNPYANLSIGIEIATPLPAFQLFIGNYKLMVPQYNNVFNSNDFSYGGMLIGFNIARLIDLEEESIAEMIFKRK